MSDEKKFPPELGLEVDPDATAVVDARRVWAALEKVDKLGAGASGESSAVIVTGSKDSPPAPASATRPVDAVEEEAESLDDGWGDDLLEEEPAPAIAAAPAPRPPPPPPPFSPQAPVQSPVAAASGPATSSPSAAESNTLSGLGTRAPVVGSSSLGTPVEAVPPSGGNGLGVSIGRAPEPLPSEPAPSQSRISTARPPPGEGLAPDTSVASAGAPVDLGSTRPPSPSSIVTPVGGMPAVHEDAHARATPVPQAPVEPGPEIEVPKAAPKPRRHGPSAVEMEDRFSIGDFAGAMEIAEELLARDPDHEEAKECVERSRVALRELYTSRLGPLDRVPVVAVARDQMRWLTIDHRAGFILSHVDGISNLEEIVDISGMAELDALRILSELVQQRIIALR